MFEDPGPYINVDTFIANKVGVCKKLIRRNARNHLENLLLKLHPADIATIIKQS